MGVSAALSPTPPPPTHAHASARAGRHEMTTLLLLPDSSAEMRAGVDSTADYPDRCLPAPLSIARPARTPQHSTRSSPPPRLPPRARWPNQSIARRFAQVAAGQRSCHARLCASYPTRQRACAAGVVSLRSGLRKRATHGARCAHAFSHALPRAPRELE